MFLFATAVQAQITIGGNVYGGGNAGNTGGSTNVTVYAGDLNNVYGGARQANVGGSAFVNIAGEHMSDDIVINKVYGGNDIAGSVGKSNVLPTGIDPNNHQNKEELKDYNTFVLTTQEKDVNRHIFIGQLYGGSNGDYEYENDEDRPNINKAYLDLHGGTIANAFGGGNKATINQATLICINNNSRVTTDDDLPDILTNERIKAMGLNTVQTQTGSSDYQFGRVFGGNNKVDMAIRPTWHLEKGKIRDLYSGGNQGGMTYYDPVTGHGGIFLTIASNGMEVNNVYGGCRMADVCPGGDRENPRDVEEEITNGLVFPAGYSTRVTITGGNINNVYGGNDISGTVYGGCAVGIHSSIKGDVYGGGNGSYAYTDNATLGQTEEWDDYFYDVKSLLGLSGDSFTSLESVQALNKFRPNAQKVTVRLVSDDPDTPTPTIIGGAVYCGGNSATLRSSSGSATAQLKIGSCVYADKVFLGSNGANMVSSDMFTMMAGNVTVGETDYDLSQIDLRVQEQMNEYMKGCEMGIRPQVIFDQPYDGVEGHEGYRDYSTYIGSFFCGGNVGSVNVPGMNTLEFTRPFIIFDKLVGGCNNAYVEAGTYNAAYDGGLIANPDPTTKNKLTLNLADLRIQPMRWVDENDKTQLLEWNTYVWDTKNLYTEDPTSLIPTEGNPVEASTNDLDRRFKGGNVYGGCYNSGHINGNVIINVNHTLMDPDVLFDKIKDDSELYGENILTQEAYDITQRRTGVILGQQGMDVLGTALNLFGGGKGKNTEIWGSTTINLNAGYVFQIFGGSEEGVIGKGVTYAGDAKADYTWDGTNYYFNGKQYTYNPNYSCTVNLKGDNQYPGVSKSVTNVTPIPDMSDTEFIYGGGFLGPICGNTTINLGNGRIFNSFAGSCNADILGHTETYMGRSGVDGTGNDVAGFPFVRDYIYGGNDMGGRILGKADFTSRVRSSAISKIYYETMPKNISSYVEYSQGYAVGLFGGCFGTYDYTDPEYKDFFYTTGATGTTDSNLGTARPGYIKPRLDKAFVNFRPLMTDLLKVKPSNTIKEIYGAGQGYPGDADRDIMQNSSYVLIDIPQEMTNYEGMEVWGAGAWSGLGMKEYIAPKAIVDRTDEEKAKLEAASAIIDLASGQIAAAYGGSYQEGVTRRTIVNVPIGSTIKIGSIFGGGYGTNTYMPCDVYEATVNWHSENAILVCDTITDKRMRGAIYGGNNRERRTLYGRINIDAPVKQDNYKYGMTLGNVFGAGLGGNTWAEYTEVNLDDGAHIYEVYGGGQAGKVHNAESVQYFMNMKKPTDYIWPAGYAHEGDGLTDDEWANAWKIGGGYDPSSGNTYWESTKTNLVNPLVRLAEMDDRDFSGYSSADDVAMIYKRYNTNVIINEGATVENYAYGGGLGPEAVVAGTTYVTLLGGKVKKDIYAAGTSGAVMDMHGVGGYSGENRLGFIASANAYIKGGTARNVYGGGWKGSVGYHMKKVDGKDVEAGIGEVGEDIKDILAETHVVVGKPDGTSFFDGIPAVERNVYGGGEGGAVYGNTYVKILNGYVGYRFFDALDKLEQYKDNPKTAYKTVTTGTDDDTWTGYYQEKLHDETYKGDGTNNLYESGCVFGGGYIDNSSVDNTEVTMYGGCVRNSIFGGGEVAAIGRGVVATAGSTPTIVKAGKTNVTLYEGYVERNVFGGGRGYDNLNNVGSLHSDGFVFGKTEVNVFGGEVGTASGLASGYGNVFGGGDVGYVYGAYQYDKNDVETLGLAKKSGTRYDDGDEGYYYKSNGTNFIDDDGTVLAANAEKRMTEDCKVLIEPRPRVKTATPVNGHDYEVGDYVLTEDLNHLKPKNDFNTETQTGDKLIWDCLDDTGIIIHNAVFAGGNTAAGSTLATAHANTPSVFGNATASINDVYHRDLITLGTGYTGGLYGDGNLTLVDGYRELNITNYGTDYYTIAKEITISEYEKLPARVSAYYELKYTCLKDCQDKDGNHYYDGVSGDHPKASTITADDLMAQFLIIQGEGTNKTYVSVTDGENGPAILVFNNTTQTWEPNPNGGHPYWKKSGVLPVYAGRLMNSIQRADFCGVFGSRMVLQGAQDRVPEIVDFTKYTINRVREVSLNQQHSVISSDLALKSGATPAANSENQDPDDYENLDKAIHGNYFGIYNIVNYLGALTSDVHFKPGTIEQGGEDKRRTDNTDQSTYGPSGNNDDVTYYQWKSKHIKDRTRNNGSSFNKVALASGVYLELTSEKSTGKDLYEKDWGYITGVVELDLINVQTGLGGGFVYAKNEHRVASSSGLTQTTLSALNEGAVTRKSFKYEGALMEWETSGNFVHSTQTIIDDCYNISNRYTGEVNPDGSGAMPAHYWYIKGSVYVYDQYISAYTGAPNAYSETVEIPLTIAAAAHGTMKLLDVRPNMYAYYSSLGNPMNDEQKLTFSEATYYKNDPISYWDWYLLSKSEKELFVEETMVSVKSYQTSTADNAEVFEAGIVKLPGDYTTWRNNLPSQKNNVGKDNEETVAHALYDVASKKWVPADEIYRSSNNMSHDTGYILTYKVNNPSKWDVWYTEFENRKNDSSKDREKSLNKSGLVEEKDNNVLVGPNNGPTYRLKSGDGAVLGQKQYKLGELISQDVETTYQAMGTNKPTTNQATFAPAYIVTQTITMAAGDVLNQGFAMPATEVANKVDGKYVVKDDYAGKVEAAYIVTKTIQLDKAEFITLNTKMTASERTALITRAGENAELVQEIQNYIQPAYYCTTAVTETNQNLYGGRYYEAGKNYRGLEAWSSMSEADRNQFIFNYDAFDLLIDPSYSKNTDGTLKYAEGQKYQYDAVEGTYDAAMANPAHYSITTPVDYTATYNEASLTGFTGTVTVKRNGASVPNVTKILQGDELVREEYEKLPNEQRHYSGIIVKDGTLVNGNYNVYVVNTSFQYGSTPYAVGTVISAEAYNSLSSDEKAYVTTLTFGETYKNETFYYCREEYEVAGYPVKSMSGATYGAGSKVPVGTVIAYTEATEGYNGYSALPNMQTNFTIHGISPTETSTLYVSRESDIFDLSKEKIITVIYQYDYEESDTHGNITPVSERHVVNIHIKFESGVPSVEDIQAPQIVLPGSKVGLQDPYVTPGAYELTGSGWELFQTEADAESHINGVEYTPATDLLYYYQNGYYVAYYAKTYLGKTYSNHVSVSVANYHDLKKVMDATTHHYYIDHSNVHKTGVTEPKIYINDYSEGGKNGLDLLKDLFDLSLVSASGGGYTVEDGKITAATDPANSHLVGHTLLNNRVGGCKDLEFFIRTDIDHSGSAWTPIGTDENCFEGTLHGDGYTISGLDKSLFHKLCGAIYNLGVIGTFNTAGIVDTGSGYVESCWIKSEPVAGPLAIKPFAVFGNPTAETSADGKVWKQVVNCYYPESNNSLYKTDTNEHGNARMMPDQSFYNGEVTYDLNDFYLNKRYHDQKTSSGISYNYFKVNADGKLDTTPLQAWYPAKAEDKNNYYGDVGYVERRYEDGDFIYAEGVVPDTDNERFYVPSGGTGTTGYYYPIWPDDYLFFGQRLHYGHGSGQAHQDLPAHINKNDGRLSMVSTSVNRVYRAPAYFRNAEMKSAYYNPYAIFAAKSSDELHTAYPDMTAIDFTGGNGDLAGGYKQGLTADDKFYPPLLDNDGLTGFLNVDLTQNLLAYTPSATENASDAATMTYTAVTRSLPDPVYRETNNTYRTVDAQDARDIFGHAVVLTGGSYVAQKDHLLVDKNDFNAPISYTFASGKRMWYQRTPADDEFVDRTKGWDAISLPFSAELVTTQTKGEITHFYDGSALSKTGDAKIGHEYWLRQYSDIAAVVGDATIKKAHMIYPSVDGGYPTGIDGEMMNKTGENKVTNTFLWDNYYNGSSHMDRNLDFYQAYYQSSREYTSYKMLTRATPYIIGFPGVTYYEFDLSGKFEPQNTSSQIRVLPKQTITFVSPTGTTIHVSDTEKAGVTHNGYTFYPSYLNEKFEAGTKYYTLYSNYDNNSSAYRMVPTSGDATPLAAFRPFFKFGSGAPFEARSAGASRGDGSMAQFIIFDDNDSEIKKEEPIQEDDSFEDLIVKGGRKVVVVKSSLHEEKEVNIVNMAGVTLAAFTIQPGETITTNVALTGVYIVRTTDGRYTKKVLVR